MTEDAPGWAARLMQWLRFAVALVQVNLLVLGGTLLGLGVLGAFPAAVAGSILLGRMRAGVHSDSLVRDFATAYRARFRRLALVGLPFWLAAVLLAVDAFALQALAADPAATASPTRAVLMALFVVVAVGAALAWFTAVGICARYQDSALRTWRHALVLPLVSPGMSVALVACLGALAVALMAYGVLVPLIGASVPLFLTGWLVDRRLAALDAAHPDRQAYAQEADLASRVPATTFPS